jgi:hypothetical protein
VATRTSVARSPPSRSYKPARWRRAGDELGSVTGTKYGSRVYSETRTPAVDQEPRARRKSASLAALCYRPRISYLLSFEYKSAPLSGKTKERYPASIQDLAPCYFAFTISSVASVVVRVIYSVFGLPNVEDDAIRRVLLVSDLPASQSLPEGFSIEATGWKPCTNAFGIRGHLSHHYRPTTTTWARPDALSERVLSEPRPSRARVSNRC